MEEQRGGRTAFWQTEANLSSFPSHDFWNPDQALSSSAVDEASSETSWAFAETATTIWA